MEQLRNLLRMMDENESLLCEALYKDLRKPKQESITFEINYIKNDVRGCINNINKWVADDHVEKNIGEKIDSIDIVNNYIDSDLTGRHPDPP